MDQSQVPLAHLSKRDQRFWFSFRGYPVKVSLLASDVGMGQLGPPVVPFYPILGEGPPTAIDCRKKGTLILTSLLEDLGKIDYRPVGKWTQ